MPYDTVLEESRLEKRLASLKIVDQGSRFLAGTKTKVLETGVLGLNAGEPYLDPWRNPLLQRGETSSVSPKHDRQPFVTSVGGNKSAVLPNNIFDVIAEAEETGGVVRRHLGRSSRFGVSDNSDMRSPAPRPPSTARGTFHYPQHSEYVYTYLWRYTADVCRKLRSTVLKAHTNLFADDSVVDPFASDSD